MSMPVEVVENRLQGRGLSTASWAGESSRSGIVRYDPVGCSRLHENRSLNVTLWLEVQMFSVFCIYGR
jgi:hypothetical protein